MDGCCVCGLIYSVPFPFFLFACTVFACSFLLAGVGVWFGFLWGRVRLHSLEIYPAIFLFFFFFEALDKTGGSWTRDFNNGFSFCLQMVAIGDS